MLVYVIEKKIVHIEIIFFWDGPFHVSNLDVLVILDTSIHVRGQGMPISSYTRCFYIIIFFFILTDIGVS